MEPIKMHPINGNVLPPAPTRPQRSKFDAAALVLKNNPGTWYLFRSYPKNATATTVAHRIRAGMYQSFRPASDYETAAREKDVYIRYVGQPSDDL